MNIDHIVSLISEDIDTNNGIRSVDETTTPEEIRQIMPDLLSKHLEGISHEYNIDAEASITGKHYPATFHSPAEGPDIEVNAVGLKDNETPLTSYENIETEIYPDELIAENPELLGGLESAALVEILRRSLPIGFTMGRTESRTFYDEHGEYEIPMAWVADGSITELGQFDGQTVPAYFSIGNVEAEVT